MTASKYVKTGLALAGMRPRIVGNNPQLYESRKHQYFANNTKKFMDERSEYTTNYFLAKVQGLDIDDPLKIQYEYIRVANVLSSPGINPSLDDHWMTVTFKNPKINNVPRGTKFWFYDNVWLCYNPNNVGAITGNAIVRQCEVTYKRLDYYGNVLEEPFVINRQWTKANDNRYQQYMVIAENYMDCVMQLNPETASLRENDRILLGDTNAYTVRGLNNFTREQTEDPNSVRLLYFALYRGEPNEFDDIENQITDGKSFDWKIEVSGNLAGAVGSTSQLTAKSYKNGQLVDRPCDYVWESLDHTVATVDSNGLVTFVGTGEAEIVCTLVQNTDLSKTVKVKAEDFIATYIAWDNTIPTAIKQFSSYELSATFYEENVPTADAITYSFSGAPSNRYRATQTGNTVLVECLYPSAVPLLVKASIGSYSVSASISLIGF